MGKISRNNDFSAKNPKTNDQNQTALPGVYKKI